MADYKMCANCIEEYNNIYNRRHYSQTNSCPECAISIHLYNNKKEKISGDTEEIISMASSFFNEGKILAIKGIGGYLLMCDATKPEPINLLRKRKKRPAKPFAVMYVDIEKTEDDVMISDVERKALTGKVAPIVLCSLRQNHSSNLQKELIAPGLDKLGVFLPYTPLLKLITEKLKKPLIATSGNLSGSPIIYKDDDALVWLSSFADYIITYDRDIVTPQDDSVVQFSKSGKQILLRRSRGIAPNYFPNPFETDEPVLAMGAELKSAFALLDKNNLFISQFLGDQASYESQAGYQATLTHLKILLKINPKKILIDKHPGYNVSQLGREIGQIEKIAICEIQHHIAHFFAVLGENNLLNSKEKILGVVWDGTGYGDDENIWGGEFFGLENQKVWRVAHLDYFPQLLGDKMSREPRLSALALCGNHEKIAEKFKEDEYKLFLKHIKWNDLLNTSSMGRFLDAIASLLNIVQFNTFEGEAAMKLEVAARQCPVNHFESYDISYDKGILKWNKIPVGVIKDMQKNIEKSYIARKIFVSLVKMIELVAHDFSSKRIAFSGGVFQNVFLVDLIEEMLEKKYNLIFHRQLSPNDESISFGQMAFEMRNR
jgi:hydrogenase maturation protein HypF